MAQQYPAPLPVLAMHVTKRLEKRQSLLIVKAAIGASTTCAKQPKTPNLDPGKRSKAMACALGVSTAWIDIPAWFALRA